MRSKTAARNSENTGVPVSLASKPRTQDSGPDNQSEDHYSQAKMEEIETPAVYLQRTAEGPCRLVILILAGRILGRMRTHSQRAPPARGLTQLILQPQASRVGLPGDRMRIWSFQKGMCESERLLQTTSLGARWAHVHSAPKAENKLEAPALSEIPSHRGHKSAKSEIHARCYRLWWVAVLSQLIAEGENLWLWETSYPRHFRSFLSCCHFSRVLWLLGRPNLSASVGFCQFRSRHATLRVGNPRTSHMKRFLRPCSCRDAALR